MAARCAAYFGRELPTLFGRVEPSSIGGHLALTHPLPSIHDYRRFNAADNISGLLPLLRMILRHMRTVYLWAMTQTHWVSQDFMASQWRSHSSIAGIIDYHIFKFMVSLSVHSACKEELVVLRNKDKERHAE